MIWLIGNRGMLGREVEALLTASAQTAPAGGLVTTDLECDITDPRALEEVARDRRPDLIINCSAYTAVDQAEEESDTAFAVNADGVENIARAARTVGAVVIHISTDYVFDGTASAPYPPDAPVNPVGVYGKSKAEGERRLRATTERHIIVRTAWLYGVHGKNFVATMLRLFAEKDEISVVDDQTGAPTYAVDLAKAVVLIARTPPSAGHFGIYHFTNSGTTTWHGFATEIKRLAAARGIIGDRCSIKPIPTSAYPTKAVRPAYSVLDTGAVRAAFGVDVPPWRDGLGRYLDQVAADRPNPHSQESPT
jgi:dTDP-4-dehydrorhamnose reductase